MRFFLCVFLALFLLPACSSMVTHSVPGQTGAQSEEDPESQKEEEGRSFLISVLLYLPNRVLDLFDVVRAGVNVGPGLGVDLTATEYLNATAMARAAVGVGYQTLRHSPLHAASEAAAGLGPLRSDADAGLSWYRSPLDFRVETHLLLVGAHGAVEVGEIFDFFAGILFFDPKEDDL